MKIRQDHENYARLQDARETIVCDVKSLMGLFYLAGVTSSAKLNVLDLWRKNRLGMELFGLIMGVNRFRSLMHKLRFDDVAIEDRQQKKNNKRSDFTTSKNFLKIFLVDVKKATANTWQTTILLPNFSGKCSFPAYMTKKQGKFGMKVWAVTDSKI